MENLNPIDLYGLPGERLASGDVASKAEEVAKEVASTGRKVEDLLQLTPEEEKKILEMVLW